jgi:hypothetical protein
MGIEDRAVEGDVASNPSGSRTEAYYLRADTFPKGIVTAERHNGRKVELLCGEKRQRDLVSTAEAPALG